MRTGTKLARTIVLDLTFYSVIFLSFWLSFFLIFAGVDDYSLGHLQKQIGSDLSKSTSISPTISSETAANLEEALSLATNLFWRIIFLLIFSFVILIVSWGVFKGLIWDTLLGKKFDFKRLKKYVLYSGVLWVLLIAIVFLSSFIVKENLSVIVFLVEFFVFFHFASLIFAYVSKGKCFSKAVKASFNISLKKWYMFLAYYFAFIIVYLLVALILNLVPLISEILGFVSVVVMIAFIRYYIEGLL